MDLQQKFYRLCNGSRLYLKRSSPTILCCVAAVGVVGTAVAAIKATPKAIKLLEEAAEEKGEKLNKVEVVVAVAHLYIPAATIGAGTIFCIFSANSLNKHHQAQLMSAYALLKNCHKGYRDKLIDLCGDERDIEVRNAIARERCDHHLIDPDVPDGKVIFYDEISGESVLRYEREIIDAEYHLNRNFVLRGYAPLNEFYEFLGLPKTEYGEMVGWTISDGYYWIDFEHRLISRDDGGADMYAIDMIFPPEPDFMRDWE